MNGWAWSRVVGRGLAIGIAVASATALPLGCGAPQAKFVLPQKAGDMPEGQSWDGVYYNPVYGYLHLVGKESDLVGRWRRTDSSHWGELNGTVEGNVFRFSWTEHRYGAIGPSADSHGTGVFVFKVGENSVGELDGQYAIQDSDKVGDWHCVKQVNMKPDLNQINGDNPMGGPAPEQWQ